MSAAGKQPVFALIDCNNFFVSCERIFRPELEGRPVVVLSSNDGCVVARSNESKRLGIPMGAPAFKLREVFQRQQVVQFSGNFELYGDISKRITQILAQITPRIEVYSVDESFLDLSALGIADYREWGRAVRARILREVGVPVSIGIATSKTLAKLAAEIAKQHDAHQGAYSFVGIGAEETAIALAAIPIGDVWGVGWRLAPKLRAEGIGNAHALSQLRPQRAQQLMGVRGRQLVGELNGTSCFTLAQEQRTAQSIMRSRTFGEDTNQAYVLEAAIAALAARAAFRLRHDQLLARRIGIFTNTNRHKPGYRRWVREVRLDAPTNDTGRIIKLLVDELQAVYSSAQQYHRLGVFLYDLVPAGAFQVDLLGTVDSVAHDREQARMQALDTINRRHGKGRLYYASQALSQSWEPKHHIRSPRYVSNWGELPVAHIRVNR